MKDADNTKKHPLSAVFREAVDKAKKIGSLPADYVGKIVLNCNCGGITSIEKTETIK